MKDKDPTLHWKGEMAGKFSYKKFSDLNVDDPFFDSLKADYPGSVHSTGFVDWFSKKSQNDTNRALVFNDEIGLGAFVYLKEENESVKLLEGELPARPRKKLVLSYLQNVIEDKGLVKERWELLCGYGKERKYRKYT